MRAACQGHGVDAVDMVADTVERSVPPQARPPNSGLDIDSDGIAINIIPIHAHFLRVRSHVTVGRGAFALPSRARKLYITQLPLGGILLVH